jgi:hypothetical protein
MRRPEHNSPIKRGVKEIDTESSRNTESVEAERGAKTERKANVPQEENAIMIRQLVTRVE